MVHDPPAARFRLVLVPSIFDPSVLKREKQIEVLRLLVEGNSIRSTKRLTGIHRDTITPLVRRFGDACRSWLDEALGTLNLRHVQCYEIWTFAKKKQGCLRGSELRNDRIGDQYLCTALDTDVKLQKIRIG